MSPAELVAVVVICPRPCPRPETTHCLGEAVNGRARCWWCGRWMPMAEALDFDGLEVRP